MSNRLCYFFATILLFVMFLLAIFSIKEDSFTFDETAHVAAGYSYLTQKDYRLNPEHPPLVKDLAAFPLLFLNLNFPKDEPSWLQKELPQWWFQFDFGTQFLYRSGNNPDKILFWSRLPMILLLLFLGWFLFFWTKKLFNKETGLLLLFLYSFSPTFLAHGRLITTDVGAALGVVLSTYFWISFLKNPKKKNIILAGIFFGLAMLLKFSLILLVPFFGLLTLVYALIFPENKKLFNLVKYLGLSLLAGLIGMVFVVWPVYYYHILNYPPEQRIRDTQFLLSTTSIPKPLINLDVFMAKNPVLKPFGQYFLGLLLATNRSTTGHSTYFLGKISANGWKSYFPVVYAIKETLAFHILTLISLLYLAWLIRLRRSPSEQGSSGGQVKKPFWQEAGKRIVNWVKSHFPEFSMLCFIGIYWLTSLTSKLNIGARHLLPAFPFTFLLVAVAISHLLKGRRYLKIKYGLLALLLFWQVLAVFSIYPHFLAYFNELAGGPDKGYLYVVDSNLDWGQDLKRLKKWMDVQGIDKIYIDYFGGGNLEYYLNPVRDYKDGEEKQREQISNGVKNRYESWWGNKKPQELPPGSYLAVSVNQLQSGRAEPAKGYDQPSDFYRWLDKYTPVTKIGHSIFVYYIK